MACYLDTSCLLKLLFAEPESHRVAALTAAEDRVVVSSLCRVEALVRIQWRLANRMISERDASQILQALDALAASRPFELCACSAALFEEAERQIRPVTASTYCRTLDRMHLAATMVFGLDRLLTNDDAQARAAKAVGLTVLMPR